jgi:hypothetical protein
MEKVVFSSPSIEEFISFGTTLRSGVAWSASASRQSSREPDGPLTAILRPDPAFQEG